VVLAPSAFFNLDPDQVSPWTRLNTAYLADPLFIRSMREELDKASGLG